MKKQVNISRNKRYNNEKMASGNEMKVIQGDRPETRSKRERYMCPTWQMRLAR